MILSILIEAIKCTGCMLHESLTETQWKKTQESVAKQIAEQRAKYAQKAP